MFYPINEEQEKEMIKTRKRLDYGIKTGKIKRGICEMCKTDVDVCAVLPNMFDETRIIWACRKHKAHVPRDSDPKIPL